MSPSRRVRAPFVITVVTVISGSALVAACSNPGLPRDDAGGGGADSAAPTVDDTGPLRVDVGDVSIDALPPNPAACPADDPGFGAKIAPCTAPESVHCLYVDHCPLRPADAGGPPLNVYVCHDTGSGGRWTSVADYTPTCPVAPPKSGDGCPCSPHMEYVACLYGTCEALDRVFYDCQSADRFESTWKVTPVSCNPPEVDGGHDAADGG